MRLFTTGARRRVHPLTRAFLETFVKTSLLRVGKALLSTIARALKAQPKGKESTCPETS